MSAASVTLSSPFVSGKTIQVRFHRVLQTKLLAKIEAIAADSDVPVSARLSLVLSPPSSSELSRSSFLHKQQNNLRQNAVRFVGVRKKMSWGGRGQGN